MTERFQGDHQGAGPDVKETAKKKQDAEAAKALIPIETQANGQLIGKDFDSEYRISNAMFLSRLLPAHYDSAQKVFAARQFAFELGLKPLTGLRQIAVIHGNPSLFGDLPLAIVRGKGKLEKFREFFIDAQGNEISYQNKNLKAVIWGAVCISKRKGMSEEATRVFTLDDAARAGLYPCKNADKPWARYTARMLQLRARSWNLKDEYSDDLNGMAIAEYDFNVLPEAGIVHEGPDNAKDITPAATKDLNDLFSDPVASPVTEAELIDPELAAEVPAEPVEAPEPVKAAEPEVFKDGLFAGHIISQVPPDELKVYYRALRAQKLKGPMDVSLVEVMTQIEVELAL